MKNFRFLATASCLIVLFALAGCGVYSFTGVAITAETLSIQQFYNDADGGPPDLAQTFTNKITDYYQANTNLALIQDDGELQLEGAVTGYRLTPVAPSAASGDFESTAQLTRLTITVQVTYINTEDDSFNFENKSFSFYSDFDNSQSLTAIEAQLIEEIYDQIILDIFNASVANW
ncbi:LPS assembly lipoprotein LptE [Fulvivirga aurantia]|uniref:LPS assembly lipoprotein LptE n=1 Tax=Fulvivirga aurantia TaxID=2529383 RepID=UPI0012BCCBA3|nr:LptE family protein [Fulvivirga aurantia]